VIEPKPHIPQNKVPNAVIDYISPNPADEGDIVTFSGHGEDADGLIVSYRWESNIEGFLSDDSTFMDSSLSVGIHAISLRVQDDNSSWSDIVTVDLEIESIEIVNIAPVAFIESIEPNPAVEGETVNFIGFGTDEDGEIVSYKWESSIDGELSSKRSFNKISLSVGTHTIKFTVRDDKGLWSEKVTETLVIQAKTVEEEPTASQEGDNSGLTTLLIGAFIIALVIVVVLVLVTTSKRSKVQVAMEVSCPRCNSLYRVLSNERPLAVQCPHCGFEGMLT
jgi:hypothetical protein